MEASSNICTKSHKFLLPIWVPYDISHIHNGNFWITYGGEVLALILGSFLNITLDIIINGFIHQACAQLDIIKHRLNKLPDRVKEAMKHKESYEMVRYLEEDTLRQAVRNHNYIMNYASKINDTFDYVIIGQFFASSLILSVLIYELSKGNVKALQYVMYVGYLTCMLTQFFSYCWFGNEITLKILKVSYSSFNFLKESTT